MIDSLKITAKTVYLTTCPVCNQREIHENSMYCVGFMCDKCKTHLFVERQE